MVEDIRKTSYKAFNKDMTCLEFQYEVGKEYEIEDGQKIKLCSVGFHSCLMPLDVTRYYNLFTSRFAEVEYWGDIDAAFCDSKICSQKIKVVRELPFKELVRCQISWSKYHYTKQLDDKGSNYQHLFSSDCFAKLISSGELCTICSINACTKITSSGYRGTIVSEGRVANIISSGDYCLICSLGDVTTITTSGNRCIVYSNGDYANIVSSGELCRIDSQGHMANITCVGKGAYVRAQVGSIITIANYTYESGMLNEIITSIITEKVDGERIKANTWYKADCGKLVEV